MSCDYSWNKLWTLVPHYVCTIINHDQFFKSRTTLFGWILDLVDLFWQHDITIVYRRRSFCTPNSSFFRQSKGSSVDSWCRKHHVEILSHISSAIYVPYVKNTEKSVKELKTSFPLARIWWKWRPLLYRKWNQPPQNNLFVTTTLSTSHYFYLTVTCDLTMMFCFHFLEHEFLYLNHISSFKAITFANSI